ncbi:MAG TPA: GNAT family N-acetyltransferase [Candidatus Margulisiibacteriota bacterium]|nr:GNAT family N-acetyltransferase [Candidatus Margulisiibacteriota bacterium]
MTHFHFLIRRATRADREALIAFNADVLRYQDAAEPDDAVAAWTQDLLDGRHPHVGLEDFCLVEDRRSGQIASSVCLISQTWSYGGIAFAVGQPELVGTHPDFRGQGLVRRQFEILHRWSAARGQQLLALDGIPGFYRQFGYEMALALHGELSVDAAALARDTIAPRMPYRIRPAVESDVAFIADTADGAHGRYLVAACRDATLWRYELHGRSRDSQPRAAFAVIEALDGSRVGFLAHRPRLLGTFLTLTAYELVPSATWEAVTPRVLQYLRWMGDEYGASAGTHCERIGLCLGSNHPVYGALQHLAPRDEGAYAWQVRVHDLPAFLRHVAPVLERRLAQSSLAEFTGQLRISLYRDGVRLGFERGRIVEVAAWRVPLGLAGVDKGVPSTAERADAALQLGTFLQLLFGYRSFDELQYAYPDCLVRHDTARTLLTAMFRKQPSDVWPVL